MASGAVPFRPPPELTQRRAWGRPGQVGGRTCLAPSTATSPPGTLQSGWPKQGSNGRFHCQPPPSAEPPSLSDYLVGVQVIPPRPQKTRSAGAPPRHLLRGRPTNRQLRGRIRSARKLTTMTAFGVTVNNPTPPRHLHGVAQPPEPGRHCPGRCPSHKFQYIRSYGGRRRVGAGPGWCCSERSPPSCCPPCPGTSRTAITVGRSPRRP